jgi:hypothetical protein
LLQLDTQFCSPVAVCMCAERTIYTWVTVWRRTGSFKQQHGNIRR